MQKPLLLANDFRFGVVIFDDAVNLIGGVAAVGGEPAERIANYSSLDQSVIWWSNIDTHDAFNKSLTQSYIKHRDYLPTNQRRLSFEIGLERSNISPDIRVEILAQVFDRVMRLAISQYAPRSLSSMTLAEDLYFPLLGYQPMPSDEKLLDAAKLAYVDRIRCPGKIPPRHKVVSFQFSRPAHAIDVLSTPVPGDTWQFLADGDMPVKGRVEFLLGLNRPVLAHVKCRNADGQYGPLLIHPEYGNWMSQVELHYMHSFATLSVAGAWLATRYEKVKLQHPIFIADCLAPISISAGLLAEVVMCAVAGPHPWTKQFPRNQYPHPRAAWLAAADRFHCMFAASCLRAVGYNIHEYGRGKVVLTLADKDMEHAVDNARKLKLLPPVLGPYADPLQKVA